MTLAAAILALWQAEPAPPNDGERRGLWSRRLSGWAHPRYGAAGRSR
jgi:hypothetical protein